MEPVYIPPGAINQDTNISIKTLMVDESKLNLPIGSRNVTKVVKSDPKTVNSHINSGTFDN